MKKIKSNKVLVIAITFLIAFCVSCNGGNEKSVETGKSKSKSHGNKTSIVFASDYQAEKGLDSPKDNFSSILDSIKNVEKNIDEIVICGDYTNDSILHDYQLSPEKSINEIKSIEKEKFHKLDDKDLIFVQGNHDKMTSSISKSGLHEYKDYLIYVLNTESDFPWKQGKVNGCLDKVKKSSVELEECFNELIERGETRPVFIAGHVPLHFSARVTDAHVTGDNLYSSLIFNVVNKAAKELDIIYFVGHNHSKGWDCYLGGSAICKKKGENILIPHFTKTDLYTDKYNEKKLNFTYLNAGYVGYYLNCSRNELQNGTSGQYKGSDECLTATKCDVYPNKIIITRFDEDGIHRIRSDGSENPYVKDLKYISRKYYSENMDSPIIIKRKLP